MSFIGSFDLPQDRLSPVAQNFCAETVHPRHPAARAATSRPQQSIDVDDDHFNIFADGDDAPTVDVKAPPNLASDPGKPIQTRSDLLDQRRARPRQILQAARLRRSQVIEADRRCMDELRHNFRTEFVAEEFPQSPELRLAVHAINYSVACVALPVGAALMTYSFLRGEDMRLTSSVTTISAVAVAVLQAGPGMAQVLGI